MSLSNNSKNPIWYQTLLNYKEIKVEMNISLPLVIGIIFMVEFANSELTMSAIAASFSFILALILHEIFHLIPIRLCKEKLSNLTIFPFGAHYNFSPQTNTGKFKDFTIIYLYAPCFSIVFSILVDFALSQLVFLDKNSTTYLLIDQLAYFSLMLGFINLLPIYPLDAYEAVRNALLKKSSQKELTQLAKLSFFLAIFIFLAFSFSNSLVGIIITICLLLLAAQEHNSAKTNKALKDFEVKDILIPEERLITFNNTTKVSQALEIALTSFQVYFPVKLEEQVIGLVSRDQLLQTGATEDDNYITSIVDREIPHAEVNDSLEKIHQKLHETKKQVILINLDKNFIGILVKDKLSEYLLIKSIREQVQKQKDEFDF